MKILRRLIGTLLIAGSLSRAAFCLPEGANVTHGTATISNAGGTQTITQGSNQAIINWNGFNIDVGELVHFVQPSTISAILNRVVGQDPSVILGAMRSNGKVFLVNPNGIVFGDTARLDVGSLVASTLNITDENFLAGNLQFEQVPDKALASVINKGTIKIDDQGFLVLTGPMVANEGVILARVGQVALAAGTQSTVSFDPTGMIQVALPAGSQSDQGVVSLTRSATSDLLASTITTSAVPAGKIVVRDGQTFLEVDSGTVVNTGQILAEGMDNQRGGKIVLDSTSHTLLGPTSVLSAQGQGLDSPGGEIRILSDGQSSSARGSLADVSATGLGSGGVVEQSSRYGRVQTSVDLSSEDGRAGTLIIDPQRIVVETGAGGVGSLLDTVYYSEFDLEGVTAGTVLLPTQNGVDFEAFSDGLLTMQNDVNLSITLDLALVDGIGDGLPAITFAVPGDSIVLSGTGAFSLTSNTGTDIQNLNVVTDTGNITVMAAGSNLTQATRLQTATGAINLTAGNIGESFDPLVLASGGDVNITSSGHVALTGTVGTIDSTSNTFRLIDSLVGQAVTLTVAADLTSGTFFDLNPLIRAADVSITAASIGAGEGQRPYFDAQNLSLTATAGAIRGALEPSAYVSGRSVVVVNLAGTTNLNNGFGFVDLLNFDGTGVLTVNLEGVDVSCTVFGGATLDVLGANDLSVFTNGAITGSISDSSLDKVTFSAPSINITTLADVDTLEVDSGVLTWDGDVHNLILRSSFVTNITTTVDLVNVEASGNNFTLSNVGGDIVTGAANINSGNITLTGANIVANTRGGNISIASTGSVDVINNSSDVAQLLIDAQNNVSFQTNGDLAIDKVSGGSLVSLAADGNIRLYVPPVPGPDPVVHVSGTGSVALSAGGTITTTGDPLHVDAVTGLSITALDAVPAPPAPLPRMGILAAVGPDAAASVNGSLDRSLVTVGAASGPVYYNGSLIVRATPPTPPDPTPPTPTPPTPTPPSPDPTPPTPPDPIPPDPIPPTPTPPTPTPPAPTPPTPPAPEPDTPSVPDVAEQSLEALSTVQDQFGQQAGQLIDDGSVGSAANDQVVEQSQTQQLVAKLVEAAQGGDGAGLTTALLVTLELDEMGEVKVTLSEGTASAVDVRIDQAEDLRANDVIDLEPEEIGEVGVSLYYDPATDRIIMAVKLRADDILDLDVSDFQEIPVKLDYVFLSDPKMIANALRANDVIDLDVEDLGLIPIQVEIGAQSADPVNSARN